MGHVRTPKYRVETGSDKRGWVTYAAWNSRSAGNANASNLESYRQALNKSFLPGGVNAHVSNSAGQVLYFSNLRIVNQKTGEVVAIAWGPMFEIVA